MDEIGSEEVEEDEDHENIDMLKRVYNILSKGEDYGIWDVGGEEGIAYSNISPRQENGRYQSQCFHGT